MGKSRFVSHIVGARPNFMKAAPVIRELDRLGVEQRIIHTGQHYDEVLSDVFFEDLGIPRPDINLGVGSGSHAEQTSAAMIGLERDVEVHRPSALVVYGDVNSTVSGALVGSKALIPVAHVEAGLRSFDLTMPEEINRRVTDALSSVLFATSPEALTNLGNEGVDPDRVYFVGNPMIDSLRTTLAKLDCEAVRERLVVPSLYGVVTLHRPANVDAPERAEAIVEALTRVSRTITLLFPVHPRGAATFERAGLSSSDKLRLMEPLRYNDFLSIVSGARLVITDSGGLQEETTVLGVPCLTIRPNTERPITITSGTNVLVEPADLERQAKQALEANAGMSNEQPPLWDGRAGGRIAKVLATLVNDS